MPRDWTDWAPPGARAYFNDGQLVIDAPGLVALAELIFSLAAGDFGLDR